MTGAFGPNPGDNVSIDESTPVLRADATDDDLDIPDSEDADPAEPGTVDLAAPGATSANGIIHGGR